MPCPPPRIDWGITTMIAGLFGMLCLTAGVLWGQKTGPPRNWMEPEEPSD